jgi:transposase-like protein
MTKTMCKKSKKKVKEIRKKKARYYCKKCHETAHKKEHLCKPQMVEV